MEYIVNVQLVRLQIPDDHVSASQEYPRGGRLEMDRDPEGHLRGMKHDHLANSSLPYCMYAGIVLLEEKIVSNSLIDLQDMWVKDIYIALACKWPPNYYAN